MTHLATDEQQATPVMRAKAVTSDSETVCKIEIQFSLARNLIDLNCDQANENEG